MHHSDQNCGVVEQQRERLVDEPARNENAIQRTIALEQQHPGKGAHENADPERQQDAGEQRAARGARKSRQCESNRIGDEQGNQRDDGRDEERVREHARVDIVAEELPVGGERPGRRRKAQPDQAGKRHQKGDHGNENARRQQRGGSDPCRGVVHARRSFRISRAALCPTTPPTPPPGCAEEPHWYRPWIGLR